MTIEKQEDGSLLLTLSEPIAVLSGKEIQQVKVLKLKPRLNAGDFLSARKHERRLMADAPGADIGEAFILGIVAAASGLKINDILGVDFRDIPLLGQAADYYVSGALPGDGVSDPKDDGQTSTSG